MDFFLSGLKKQKCSYEAQMCTPSDIFWSLWEENVKIQQLESLSLAQTLEMFCCNLDLYGVNTSLRLLRAKQNLVGATLHTVLNGRNVLTTRNNNPEENVPRTWNMSRNKPLSFYIFLVEVVSFFGSNALLGTRGILWNLGKERIFLKMKFTLRCLQWLGFNFNCPICFEWWKPAVIVTGIQRLQLVEYQALSSSSSCVSLQTAVMHKPASWHREA